ncbi:MAG: hypothetical protein H6909_01240 [Rickettsiaceae bacterium]|nr:hypothetical protein [Rickettsiaceae bacterium]
MSINIETSDAILGEVGGWNEMTDCQNAADTQSGSYDYKNDFDEVRVVVEDFVSEPYNKIWPVKEESVDENSTANEIIQPYVITKEAMEKLMKESADENSIKLLMDEMDEQRAIKYNELRRVQQDTNESRACYGLATLLYTFWLIKYYVVPVL